MPTSFYSKGRGRNRKVIPISASSGRRKMTVASVIPIYRVKAANTNAGQHFFDKDTMRFFNSKVAPEAYTKDGKTAYFITSEQHGNESRKYTVRKMDMETGSITTVGEFQEHDSLSEAKRTVSKILDANLSKSQPYKTRHETINDIVSREYNFARQSTTERNALGNPPRFNGHTNWDTWETMLLLENTRESDRWLNNWSDNFNKKIKAGTFNPEEAEKAVEKYIIPAARGSQRFKWAVGRDFTPDENIDPKKVNKAEIVRRIVEKADER